MREKEMVEIALRVPRETVRALLAAAAEALIGAEGRAPMAVENGGFQEETFGRLSRAEEIGAKARPGTAEERPSRAEDEREAGAAEDVPRKRGWGRSPRRGTKRQSGEGAEGPFPVEPAPPVDIPLKSLSPKEVLPKEVLSERGLRGTALGVLVSPARRGSGTAGRRLSAPEPASYAVERPMPLGKGPAEKGLAEWPMPAEKGPAERPMPAEKGPAELESGTAAPEKEAARGAELSPKALSDRWERDSRRYDGGFTLY